MRVIQVWRWTVPAPGQPPRPDTRDIAVPEPIIERVFAGLYTAWQVSGGNGLPAPAIVERVDRVPEGGPYPPIPIDPSAWPTRSFPGFATVGPGASMGAPPTPPPGDESLERFTGEQLQELGTCPDCASVVLFEKLPEVPFTYRCVTVHDQTCPEWARIRAEADAARRRATGETP